MEKPVDETLELSVVVATRNGEEWIGEALQSLLRQTLAAPRFEIIVVNNGSSDRTAEVVEELISRGPGNLRLLSEEVPGLSRARNTGLRAGRGRIVAFLDDDARADPEWLSALAPLFDDPRVAAAGGPIELTWTSPAPAWWSAELDPVQGRLDYGPRPRRLTYPEVPYGSNLAVRRTVLERIGLFRESLGRTGQSLMAGEELELCLRIIQAGYEIAYEPAARVHHLAIPRRATREYLQSQAYWHGRSQRLVETLVPGPWLTPLPRLPFLLLKSLGGYLTKHRLSLASRRGLIFRLGYTLEALKCLFSPPRTGPPPSLEGRE